MYLFVLRRGFSIKGNCGGCVDVDVGWVSDVGSSLGSPLHLSISVTVIKSGKIIEVVGLHNYVLKCADGQGQIRWN